MKKMSAPFLHLTSFITSKGTKRMYLVLYTTFRLWHLKRGTGRRERI